MIYKSKNAGFLTANDVKDGEIVRIIEDVRETFSEAKQQTYLNCKVELPDGSQRVASIDGNFGADAFAEAWGEETAKWVGNSAKICVKKSKAGNNYVVLVPVAEKEGGKKDQEVKHGVDYPQEEINPADIPF